MTEILHAYETLKVGDVQYCLLCLRTSDERRLVNSNYPISMIKRISKTFNLDNKSPKLCYLCERQAAAAHRFHRCVSISHDIHTLFSSLTHSKTLLEHFYQHYHGTRKIKKEPPEQIKNLPKLEKQLTTVKSSTTLLQTEVLVLNTQLDKPTTPPSPPPPPPTVPPAPPSLPTPLPVTSHDTHVVCLDSEPVEQNVLAEPEIYMDSVVILDDEEDPIELLKEERPDSPLLVPDSPPLPSINAVPIISTDDPQLRLRNNVPNTNILKHTLTIPTNLLNLPKNQNLQNNMLNLLNNRPNLQNNRLPKPQIQQSLVKLQNNSLLLNNTQVIQNNQNTNLGLNTQNNTLILPNNQQILPNNTLNPNSHIIVQNSETTNANYLLHPIVQNNGLITVPSLSAQIVNGQLVIVDNSNLIVSTPKLAVQNGANLQFVLDPQDVTQVLNTFNKPNNNINPNNNTNLNNNTTDDSNDVQFLPDEDEILPDLPKSAEKHKVVDERQDVKRRKQDDKDLSVCLNKVQEAKDTDWEDKIPMDVISFMDATDPNADEALRSKGPVKPLDPPRPAFGGFITDVRSIVNDPLDDDDDEIIIPGSLGLTGSNSGAIGSNSGVKGSNLGVKGLNSGVKGSNSGAIGSNSGVKGSNLGVKGLNSGVKGSNSGVKGSNSGLKGSNSGKKIKGLPTGKVVVFDQNTGKYTIIGQKTEESTIIDQNGKVITGHEKGKLAITKECRVVLPNLDLKNINALNKKGPSTVRKSETGKKVSSWGKNVHVVTKQ